MKTIDIIFIQYLDSIKDQASILDIKRVNVEESEMTTDTEIKIINKFFTDTDVRKSTTIVPDEVLSVITELSNINDLDKINNYLSALRTRGFEFLMIDRFDLSGSNDIELDDESPMYSYVWNFDKSNSELLCSAIGCANIYTEDNYKTASAGDFLSMFNLSEDDIKLNGLVTAKNSYEVLKSKKELESYDDESMIVFLNSRNWNYYRLYSV